MTDSTHLGPLLRQGYEFIFLENVIKNIDNFVEDQLILEVKT